MSTSHSAPGSTRSRSTSRLPDATTPMIDVSFLPDRRRFAACLNFSVSMARLLPITELVRRVVQIAGPVHQILNGLCREHAALRVQRIDAQVFRAADNFARAQLLDHFPIARAAHIGEARDAADGLLALLCG